MAIGFVALIRCVALVIALGFTFSAGVSFAQDEEEAEFGLTKSFLSDDENIATGAAVWEKRCRFCHGKGTYPGKAPKLQPSRYQPGFIFARVTFGFRGMPAFDEEFTDDERKSVVAYILSDEFAP
ncbi:MAG: hypothetical protein CMM50_04930 [Rhodospirillaceae bacterium]|jgi:mono/diheme cytochrome c family protein|nr:hypothetical protein [Rhodospirillaceae bacterium]|tara:strand:- start:977 stop:1351 length:375 start_codon:yes stop_codon:yes gene_type:complete